MNVFKSIGFILQKVRITMKINNLQIKAAGTDDGMPFVELEQGLRFYGLEVQDRDRKYYNLLKLTTRNMLPFKCYKTALDIVIRYVEGGLKLGGPKKEKFYQVKEGDLIAEMGAYMGFYTMYLAEKAGESGKVIAIEPIPENLKYLKKNIAYNNLENVVIVERGVWNRNEIQTLYRTGKDTQSASLVLNEGDKKEYQIQMNTLDKILKDNHLNVIDLMLIQLNGVEAEALEGLTEIKPDNMAIAARYDKDGYKVVPRIKRLLNERSYKVKVVQKDYIFASQI